MRRWLATIGIAVALAAPLGADVTLTMTTTIEGGMAAMGGGNTVTPTIITRIKGDRSRMEVDMGAQKISTLVDLKTGQVTLLNHEQKTAHVMDPKSPPPGMPAMGLPTIETVVKPTGQRRQISGANCDEFQVTMRMDMSSMATGSSDMPPAAAAMLKDMKMTIAGSVWVAKDAPGAAEYLAFQASASKLALTALGGGSQRMPAGMERLVTGFKEAPGIPYLSEMTMEMEGGGQMAEMMKKMGAMKIISRVTSVSVAPLADDLFAVPAGYTMAKPQ